MEREDDEKNDVLFQSHLGLILTCVDERGNGLEYVLSIPSWSDFNEGVLKEECDAFERTFNPILV